MYLLDTHTWLWAIADPRKLSQVGRRALERNNRERLISAISIFEYGQLLAKGRLRATRDFDGWLESATTGVGVEVISMTPEIAIEAVHLPGGFHQDPMDRIIVATARVRDLVLITAD